ncbi:GNAT family N-acetyltransferase [Rhodococcus sp. ZPP]|uniref:GNAT family N-acetyltransferase n=1 Tax=Rhodococcus sp. ZPP TaxID=2749906 RepID=UPI001FCBD780|nr:GNAT family N-acetyltransferase [Rhodococcus sp. ZPP]
MDPHHLDIVRLAWSRELGLADDALTDRPGRATRADPEADTLRFLDLRGTSAMVGPDWILRRAERLSDRDLTEPATLLALVQDRSGRCSGPLTLWFTSDYQEPATGRPPVVSDDRGHVRELETACPPDDVTEAHLSTRDRWFTILDDAQQPVSSAGYSEFQGFVADVAVLTAPLFRCRGARHPGRRNRHRRCARQRTDRPVPCTARRPGLPSARCPLGLPRTRNIHRGHRRAKYAVRHHRRTRTGRS